ncbi:hotdog fold thioesterase [Salirhabdus salicampi]|uniref:hotdog fold thioesterase n=1 Tax=Salirhabdus salicampi TaxID=476102 RepID=UPI0020C29A94|nr:hotdog fold thioesterase [Salirhabdus salicampi]MCP8617784.1 hotdog fold thioesterase [Salirhabdus salicampi]
MDFSNTLMEALGIEAVKLEKDEVILTMPVTAKTHQPMGFLHGGASVALAESAASIGAFLNVDHSKYNIFGIEINANHVKSKRSGTVKAIAKPMHIGKTTMVWEIQIQDEEDNFISISRCTIGVVEKK